MPLTDHALVGLEETSRILGLAGDSADRARVEMAINMATAMAEVVYCGGRPLKRRAFANVRVAGPCLSPELHLRPPLAWPIDLTAAVSVTLNGEVQTVWTSESDGDPDDKDVQVYSEGLFYRCEGWAPTGRTPRNVLLSFTGGFDPVPEALREAVIELVLKLWAPIARGQVDVASMASGGTTVQTLDGMTVGGSSYAITRRSQEIFETYAYRSVG